MIAIILSILKSKAGGYAVAGVIVLILGGWVYFQNGKIKNQKNEITTQQDALDSVNTAISKVRQDIIASQDSLNKFIKDRDNLIHEQAVESETLNKIIDNFKKEKQDAENQKSVDALDLPVPQSLVDELRKSCGN